MRRLGAEKPAFDTIVAAGARTALPHASPTAARFRPRDAVLVDMGAMQEGYASDMTRMLFFGTPGAKMRKLYRAVLEAQLAAIDARAGRGGGGRRGPRRAPRTSGRRLRQARSPTPQGTAWAWKSTRRRCVGRREKLRLQAGMAITIEPGAYIEGFGGVRIEDTVVVTAAGLRSAHAAGKELRVI